LAALPVPGKDPLQRPAKLRPALQHRPSPGAHAEGARIHRLAAALVAALLLALAGCGAPPDEKSPTLGFSVASGVSIPAPDDLKGRIDSALRAPGGSKGYVMQSSSWVQVKVPAVTQRANATVRSFNAAESAAFVEVAMPEHKSWVLQVWRFQGGAWTDDVGPVVTPSSPKS